MKTHPTVPPLGKGRVGGDDVQQAQAILSREPDYSPEVLSKRKKRCQKIKKTK
jgi:hypothetical protein